MGMDWPNGKGYDVLGKRVRIPPMPLARVAGWTNVCVGDSRQPRRRLIIGTTGGYAIW